ncbi:MAG: N-acetylmuramoyl-L-alanine amidase [Candidatus Viridilinea halotolerans]|uniref:N-acetylmuramoyl-L-alanine amidase n=1 Tax=Candidatus Viridilinea halotolerans TaxID=2491704 RepID=A0A426TS18_9CHLR|nr:MAG: N-acetylmuramoyl-L-alanine amidase [Candidatus Viridilinea halotolerans]
MDITWIGMTRQHYQPGQVERIRMVVIHATAGRYPGDLAWLRQGGDERRPVSCHYYIDKGGQIRQLVKDGDIAWHAGVSRWEVDGAMRENLNTLSLGIELENLNSGRDPYPELQLAAAVALTRLLVRRYQVPPRQLVRHLEISPGRKTDPAGFPWASFVARVYAEAPQPAVAAEEQVRQHMLDLAYRAAGSGLSAAWPLHAAAQRMGMGMPVALISNAQLHTPANSAPDDLDRTVRLPDQPPLFVEVYARDLLYASVNTPSGQPPMPGTVRQLAKTPDGPLYRALLDLMFRAADPVNGFREDWAFHQHVLDYSDELGVPLGPNHRLTLMPRRAFACQHYALDSLCSPVGAWKTIYRLSELEGNVPGLSANEVTELRRALLDDLYRTRTGRRYDPVALLSSHAAQHELGAPLGPPEVVMIAEEPYLLMPFACDVLACRLPALNWPLERPLPTATEIMSLVASAPVRSGLNMLLGGGGLLRRLITPRRNQRSRVETLPNVLLGPPTLQPSVLDLGPTSRPLDRAAHIPERVVITISAGPASLDLRSAAELKRWHYYLDAGGVIYRLRDELMPVEGMHGSPVLVVAVEGDPARGGVAQRSALSWLVRSLAAMLKIPPEGVLVGAGARA